MSDMPRLPKTPGVTLKGKQFSRDFRNRMVLSISVFSFIFFPAWNAYLSVDLIILKSICDEWCPMFTLIPLPEFHFVHSYGVFFINDFMAISADDFHDVIPHSTIQS